MLERDTDGNPKHRTAAQLFDPANDGKETEFERLLYQAFDERPDPQQLWKILKRKLQMADPDFGPRQAKYID